MRQRFEVQLALGAVPIERVETPTRTRDEMPPTLAALQWVFTAPQVSSEVFRLLEDRLVHKVGMESIASLSFDCGFSSVENRELLELCLPSVEVVMPKKGKLSAADQQR